MNLIQFESFEVSTNLKDYQLFQLIKNIFTFEHSDEYFFIATCFRTSFNSKLISSYYTFLSYLYIRFTPRFNISIKVHNIAKR